MSKTDDIKKGKFETIEVEFAKIDYLKYASLGGAIIVILSAINLGVYYDQFGIDVLKYIEVSEYFNLFIQNWLIYLSGLTIVIVTIVVDIKGSQLFKRNKFRLIGLLLFVFLFFVVIVSKNTASAILINPKQRQSIQIFYTDSTRNIESSDTLIFVGSTNSYFYFHNPIKSYNILKATNNIESIKFIKDQSKYEQKDLKAIKSDIQ